MAKYNNKKIQIDGYTFDSLKEGTYYHELKLRKRAKDIIDFEVHPKEILQGKFINNQGKTIREITYTPDFLVFYNGYSEFIDVKGGKATQTEAWKIKWKLIQKKYKDMPMFKFTVV